MRLMGRLLAPEDRGICVLDVTDGIVHAIASAAADAACDAGGPDAIIIPGLVDIQLNGAFGVDFSDPASDLAAAALRLPSTGVTAFVPTVITAPPDRMAASITNLAAATTVDGAARALGIHVEGPFLAPERVGAHDPDWLRPPSIDEALGWLAAGPVRIVTLAPELPGATQLIKALRSRGILVALGHSDASWAEAEAAIRAGATLGTHLFNAMRPFHHRDPGIVGRLLAPGICVSLIADGVHVAPDTIRLVAAAKADDELMLITDGLAALGESPGAYTLAGDAVISDGTVAHRADGTLAGSVLPMAPALGLLVSAGLDATVAVRAASTTPATLLGREETNGTVAEGRVADLVVLDADWQPRLTLVGGRISHGASALPTPPHDASIPGSVPA